MTNGDAEQKVETAMQMKDCGVGVADTSGGGHGESGTNEDRARMESARRYSFDGHTPNAICPRVQSHDDAVGWMKDSVAPCDHRRTMN